MTLWLQGKQGSYRDAHHSVENPTQINVKGFTEHVWSTFPPLHGVM